MDLQTFLDNQVKAHRASKLHNSDQLTIGEIILKTENILANKDMDDAKVVFDFGNFFPTAIDSWRGSYDELALNYEERGESLNATQFLDMLRKAVGEIFYGYKGGEFTMSRHTPVWVANYGYSGNTAVVEVFHNGWQIVLVTAYREF